MAAAGSTGAGPAAAASISLPWPGQPVVAEPPLSPPTLSAPLNRFRGRIAALATVSAGVEPGGGVRTASVSQRLAIRGLGDYVLTIPAPVVGVERGEGSQSEPGQRRNAIIWQGFSPGRRTLVARATLRTADTKAVLPLRVRIVRHGGFWDLEVANTTRAVVESFTGSASPRAVARYGRLLRGFSLPAPLEAAPFADVTAIRPLRRTPSASFGIRGTIRFRGAPTIVRASAAAATVAGRTVRFTATLGGPAPQRLRLRLRGRGVPRLALRAVPQRVVGMPATFDGAIDAALGLALTRQYESFLVNPDLAGRSETVYLYHSERAAVSRPAGSTGSERGIGQRLLVAALLLVGATAGLILWARS